MTQQRRRIAFLTCHLPYPPHSGGRRRDYELIVRLARDHDVHLCVGTKTYEQDVANLDALRDVCTSIAIFPKHGPPDADHPDLARLPAQIVDNVCPALTEHVSALVLGGAIDLVHAEGYYMMQHVPREARVPVFLVEQNVEYMLWRQRTETAHDPRLRSQVFREYLKTLEAEIETWYRSDLVGALTEDDREGILSAAPGLDVRIVPDGADHLADDADAAPLTKPAGGLVVFVANFGYQPNVDAGMFLCSDVFPRIRAMRPSTQLWLVGNAPPVALQDVASAQPGVTVTGAVPSVVPYLDAADVVVCPLRIGGGIKVKVIEALMRGKAVVTTSIGAQGFGSSFNAALLADDAGALARGVVALLANPRRRRVYEKRALEFSRSLPTWDDAVQAVVACYDEILARSRSQESALD